MWARDGVATSIEDFCSSFSFPFLAAFSTAPGPELETLGNNLSPLSQALTRGGTSRSSARRELRMDGRVSNAGRRKEGVKDDNVVLRRVRMESYIVHDVRGEA